MNSMRCVDSLTLLCMMKGEGPRRCGNSHKVVTLSLAVLVLRSIWLTFNVLWSSLSSRKHNFLEEFSSLLNVLQCSPLFVAQ